MKNFIAPNKILEKIICIVFFLPVWVFAQVNQIKGVVRDARSGEPLAFVSISTDVTGVAAMSDIEGRFQIKSEQAVSKLNFSFVGYQPKSIQIVSQSTVEVFMESGGISLKTAVIVAGENPAHRIIRQAVANRDRHNPSRLPAYSCELYNKLVFTGIPDTISSKVLNADEQKSRNRADSLFDRQHLFMMESVTERRGKAGKVNEEVIGSRVSGLKDASFLMLMMQLQPFSFYEDYFGISGTNYLNPISKGSEDRYFFALEDTLFSGKDTTFIISFKPRQNKVFDALKGLIYISAPDFAIQNVIAEPAKEENTQIKVQQQYQRINGQWFPEQLNTNITFKTIQIPGYHVVGVGRNYVRNVNLDPDLSKVRFSEIEMDVSDKASRRDSIFWKEVRIEELSPQEQETFRVLDSISKAQRFDTKLKALEGLFNGMLPVWLLEIDLDRLIRFNDYEGFRLGIGLATNNRVSKRFKLGGHVGYGFKDDAVKYGAFGQLVLSHRRDMRLELRYINDLQEAGNQGINGYRRLIGNERIRDIFIRLFDFQESVEGSLTWRWAKYLRHKAYVRQTLFTPMYNYAFQSSSVTEPTTINSFQVQEVGLSTRWAPGEKFFRNSHLLINLGSKQPVFWFQSAFGNVLLNGVNYPYNRSEFKFEYTKAWRKIGPTILQINASAVFGEVPFSLLINPPGNFATGSTLRVASRNVFETMGMNEFVNDRYASAFITQRVGTLMKIKKFAPQLALMHQSGIGTLRNPEAHQGIDFRLMNHGFHESGFAINRLINNAFANYGIAFFYRYGAYYLPEFNRNFTIKLTIGLTGA